MLREVHEGACRNHSGARSLIHKVVCVGYYWPTLQADAKAYVKVCDQCQRFSNVPRQPSKYLTPMMASWPFTQWGLDILGPFPLGTRHMKFLVVSIDYFTKWVLSKSTNSYTRPYGSSIERPIRMNQIYQLIIPGILDNLSRLWTDEVP